MFDDRFAAREAARAEAGRQCSRGGKIEPREEGEAREVGGGRARRLTGAWHPCGDVGPLGEWVFVADIDKRILPVIRANVPANVTVSLGGSITTPTAMNEVMVAGKVKNVIQIFAVVFIVAAVMFRPARLGPARRRRPMEYLLRSGVAQTVLA